MTTPLDASARLYLIDGSGYIFRAYHALPPLTRASDGMPVGAVSGFCNMLWKFIEDMKTGERPTHLAVIFDRSAHTFRNEIYPAYKAQRPPPPEDLVPQFQLIREATRAFGLPAIDQDGFEADDLIATYARQAAALGARVRIISSDKDLMQLIEEDKIELYDPMKLKPLGVAEVKEKFGVTPDKVVDVQALMGDSVDNVPGAPGIGPKTAAELIAMFGDLEGVLARAGEIKQPKRREAIENNIEQIRISRRLVELKDDVAVETGIETFALKDFDHDQLIAFLKAMEFTTLTRRVREHIAKEGAASPAGSMPNTDNPGPDDIEPPIDLAAYETVSDEAALQRWITAIQAAGFVCVDTETDSLDVTLANLVGISLAIGPNQACYIPVGHQLAPAPIADLFSEQPVPAPETESSAKAAKKAKAAPTPSAPVETDPVVQLDRARVLEALKTILEDPSILKIGQNIKYDLSVFARYGVAVAPIDDTMLLSYVLAAGLHGHGMDYLSEKYLSHKPIAFSDVAGSGKNQITFDRVPIAAATRYAAEDADVTLRLYRRLKPQVAKARLSSVYETLERPMPPVLAAMERAGIKVDLEILSRLSGDFAQRMAAMEAEAHEIAGKPFNIGSPKQLGEILFDDMKLPGGVKTKTGAWGTDASVLEDLAAQGHALPRVLLDWRQLQKLRSTYTEALREAINPKTGRVHTSFALAATTTGRLSSSDPNLQNIPIRTDEGRRIREAFVAEAGHVLISADYSQIELRLLAHVADIPALKNAFAAGLDIHAMTASEMFCVPIEGMDPMVRRQAKAINFGIIYGISAFGLANNLSIPQDEAGAYIKKYFERFPGIKDYMERMKAEARANGYVTTIFGRRCHLSGIKSKTPAERAFAERQAINAPLQGAAADIIRRAMIRMPTALARAGLKTRMLLQVHDELIFEAPANEADAACALIREVMESAAFPAATISVPLVVEAKAAATWALAH